MNTTAIRRFEHAYQARIFDAVIPFVGRVLLSAIFLASGIGKLTAPADTIGYIASEGLPLPPLAYAAAILVELIGGITLVGGFRTAALATFSLATAATFHSNL